MARVAVERDGDAVHGDGSKETCSHRDQRELPGARESAGVVCTAGTQMELGALIFTHSLECTLEKLLPAERACHFTDTSAYNKTGFLNSDLIENQL